MWLVYDLNPVPNEPVIEVTLQWFKNDTDVEPILTESKRIDVLDRYATAEKLRQLIKQRAEQLDQGLIRFQQIQDAFGFAPSSRVKITQHDAFNR